MIEAYPLHWPVGYKRTASQINSRFKITMDQAQRFLRAEISRMGGTELIVSTNIPIKKDGLMYADWMSRRMDDSGVAIYFTYKKKKISMCCDQYIRVWENVYALGKGIEALRGMERWGVSDFLDRAFTGFKALPDSIEMDYAWYKILNVDQNASVDEIKAAYKAKVKVAHPDAGGSVASFNLIQKAYDQGMSLHK